jgi:hypothetical protein
VRISFAQGIVAGLCVVLHGGNAAARTGAARIQSVVDDLRSRLAIPQQVVVTIVPHNPLVVSVARAKTADATFTMSIEDGFLDEVSDDELSSVIAHELGHVWIFTHHPYLQTEEGANEIALRVVSRASLDKLYERVWRRAGTKGDLVYMPPLK